MTSSPHPDQSDEYADRSASTDGDFVWPDDPTERKRAIELELKRIRSEASAARLEARAAELELMLRQIDHEPSSPGPVTTATQFESWNEVRDAQLVDLAASTKRMRVDSGNAQVRRPVFLDRTDAALDENAIESAGNNEVTEPITADHVSQLASNAETTASTVGQIDIIDDAANEPERLSRRRPLTVLMSVALHVLLLMCLGWFTLTVSSPKDQIAFTGTPSTAPEVQVESMAIETTEVEVQPDTPTTDVEYEFSPVGNMVAAKFSPDPVESQSPSALDAGMLGQQSAASMSLATGDSAAKIEFCGIKGGGNHFVYLVDSSGSMGDAFASARLELLRSIDLLKPEQRFYVVFFDEEPDYMRLSNPTVDETASVMATPANKEKLRQWVMRITMNKGRAPYDPIEFALSLRPDVIFLLSDGEFPERLVEKLDQENRIENLFGDVKPISIVHTIGYHSREGEARMKVIAKKNGGQYRYVRDPKESR